MSPTKRVSDSPTHQVFLHGDPPTYQDTILHGEPPTYQDTIESDSTVRRMHSIIQQTYSRGTDFSARLSGGKVRELAWFLIDVLAIDYDYNNAPVSGMTRRRRGYTGLLETLRYLHQYYVPDSASAPVTLSRRINSFFGCLHGNFYRPAEKLGILPSAIDAVLHRYFKYTPRVTGGCYMGCVQEVYDELGVDGLAEKISWDWIHLSKPLERFSARSDNKRNEWSSALHYKSMLRLARNMLPRDHPTRYLMERVVLASPDEQVWQDVRAEVEAQWMSDSSTKSDWHSSKELQELVSQGDRWLRFTDCSGEEARRDWITEAISSCAQS